MNKALGRVVLVVVVVAVVAAVIAAIVGALGNRQSSTPPEDAERHHIVEPTDSTGGMFAFGTWVEYDDGLRVPLAEPRLLTGADVGAVGEFEALIAIDIEVVNGRDAELDMSFARPSVVSGNIDARRIWDLSDEVSDVLAPGSSSSFTLLYGVRDPRTVTATLAMVYQYDVIVYDMYAAHSPEPTANVP